MKEHWRAFGPEWFIAHQTRLLWALNTPGIGRLMRRALRINMEDVWMPRNTRIIEIAPNYYTVRLPTGEYCTDFRTHWKYAKRVYYSWETVWWLMHHFDAVFADRMVPALSFGFSTLTAYPDPNPESTTVDGYAGQNYSVGSGVSWATITGAAGSASNDANSSGLLIRITSDNVSDKWIQLERTILLFNTSSLGASAEVTAATLSVKGSGKSDSATAITPDVNIYTSAPASDTAVASGDFDSLGSVAQSDGVIAYADYSITNYNDFVLNATGLGNISLTGISKFGARNANYDVASLSPTWSSLVSHTLSIINADTAGTSSDPKIVVTYTLPGGGGSGVASGPRGLSIFRSKGRR